MDSRRPAGLYVYGIVAARRGRDWGDSSVGGAPSKVRTVVEGAIAAIVSDVRGREIAPTRENLLAHQAVAARIIEKRTLLPMAFGSTYASERNLVRFLRTDYEELESALQSMRGKVELSLQVLWDRDEVLAQLHRTDAHLERLHAAMQAEGTYSSQIECGRYAAEAVERRAQHYVDSIVRALRDATVASRLKSALGDNRIMNAAFLVERTKRTAFDEALDRVGAKFPKLTFRATGPWPPSHFVTVRAKARESEARV